MPAVTLKITRVQVSSETDTEHEVDCFISGDKYTYYIALLTDKQIMTRLQVTNNDIGRTVFQNKEASRRIQALKHMCTQFKNHKTGKIEPCGEPAPAQKELFVSSLTVTASHLTTVNKFIQKKYPKYELKQGNGYCYFVGPDTDRWYTSSVPVAKVAHLTPQEWLRDLEELMTTEKSKYLKAATEITAIIKKEGSKWCVRSPSNKDWNGGCYDSKKEAEDRLKQVEYFKHSKGSLVQVVSELSAKDSVLAAELLEAIRTAFDEYKLPDEWDKVGFNNSLTRPEKIADQVREMSQNPVPNIPEELIEYQPVEINNPGFGGRSKPMFGKKR